MIRSEVDALLDSLDGIGTPHCKEWRGGIIRKYPLLVVLLVRGYRRASRSGGHVAANTWLREVEPLLTIGTTPLNVGSDDRAVKDYSEVLARNLKKDVLPRLRLSGPLNTYLQVKSALQRIGIFDELPEDAGESQIARFLKRCCDPRWISRRLFVLRNRGYEAFVREHGLVNKRHSIYVSELNFQRRISQKSSNRALMETLEAENELGQRYTLAELSDLGVSNPVLRRAELMTRMRGFEDAANAEPDRYTGILFSLTCPSKYHVAYESGRKNPKFGKFSPRQAQEYLMKLWARTRSAWDREGIHPFGMRVVEPHHDGTPHWHLMLFIPRELTDEAIRIFRGFALAEDGGEPGAAQRRLDVKRIDPEKGSATGYIAKYIAKNIDGFMVGEDSYGRDAIVSALRIEAWASLWGIRQFQQIGGPSVSVYRELRRMERQADEKLEKIRFAADAGNWAEYIDLMGGVICPRKARPIRPLIVVTKGPNSFDGLTRAVKGIIYRGQDFYTRVHTWVISAVAPGVCKYLANSLIRGTPQDSGPGPRGVPWSSAESSGRSPGEAPGKFPGALRTFPRECLEESQEVEDGQARVSARGVLGDSPERLRDRPGRSGEDAWVRARAELGDSRVVGPGQNRVSTGADSLEFCQ